MLEGITGVGKSAAAEYITDYLESRGLSAEYYEGDHYDHPADYTFHAYMRLDQIKKLKRSEQIQLYAEGAEVQGGLVIPLTKISVSLFEKVLPYKMYGRLDWETESPVMLERWLTFSQKAQAIGQIFIFEGSFLQNPICETLIRFNMERPRIEEYIKAVYQLISMLRPVIIYLRSNDIADCLEQTGCWRGSRWLDKLVEQYMGMPYARDNGLSGKDGLVSCLKCRQDLELGILESLPCKKLVIDDPYRRWESAQQTIGKFIDRLLS